MNELEILARGWLARAELDAHANAVGSNTGLIGLAAEGSSCPDCGRATAAWLRGASPETLESLYCDRARELRAQIKAAGQVAVRVLGR